MAYAQQSDLTNVGLPQTALIDLVPTQINAQLQAASDFMDGFFGNRYGRANVPLVTWDTSVTLNCARITVWYLMTTRGIQAGNPDFEIFRLGYTDAVDWLNKVQRQQLSPLVTLIGGAVAPQQPNLISSSVVSINSGRRAPNRGW
jgi:phage gp36-like protein